LPAPTRTMVFSIGEAALFEFIGCFQLRDVVAPIL
jgi:hypothetical protein